MSHLDRPARPHRLAGGLLAGGCIVVGLLVGGCTWSGGTGGSPGTWAPQVTSSFPDSGIQTLSEGSSLTFTAAGEDIDSLDLEWEWLLDEGTQAMGEDSNGVFDATWTLDWAPEGSGFLHDVTFVVRDPDGNATELYWPVQAD